MKVFAVVLLFALAAVCQAKLNIPDSEKETHKKLHQECGEISKVDKELVKKSFEGNFVDDPKLKEHILCMQKKVGSLKEDGTWDIDNLKKRFAALGEKNGDVIIKECAKTKATPQETAFEYAKCWYEKSSLKA